MRKEIPAKIWLRYLAVIVNVLVGNCALQAQAPAVVPFGQRGESARVTPHVDDGYVEIEMIGSDGRRVGKPAVLPLRNQVVPEIAAKVASTGGGFRFDYLVRNGESAKQRINNWDLVLPAKEAVGSTGQPKLWQAAAIVSQISQVSHGLDGAVSGAIFSWYRAHDSAAPIAPGEILSGFVLNSSYMPGIVYSYSFGEWPDDSVLGELPSEVSRALLPYTSTEGTSQSSLTIGPFFPPGTAADIIVDSYRKRLVAAPEATRAGMRDSFVTHVLELLSNAGRVLEQDPRNTAALAELCGFCEVRQEKPAEEAIRQGVRAAVCAK